MEDTIFLKCLLMCYSLIGKNIQDLGDYKALLITFHGCLTQPQSVQTPPAAPLTNNFNSNVHGLLHRIIFRKY